MDLWNRFILSQYWCVSCTISLYNPIDFRICIWLTFPLLDHLCMSLEWRYSDIQFEFVCDYSWDLTTLEFCPCSVHGWKSTGCYNLPVFFVHPEITHYVRAVLLAQVHILVEWFWPLMLYFERKPSALIYHIDKIFPYFHCLHFGR